MIARAEANRSPLVLAVCYLGFVSLGLPDTLIGVAWPSVRGTFGLNQSDLSWVFIGGGCAYFLSSFFAGRLLTVMNVGLLLAASSGLVALSGAEYALARTWAFFIAGALLQGLGSGAIDAGLNHYVATHFSPRHMNWLHACYSLGAMLGPVVMSTMVTRFGSWRMGYATVALLLAFLALLFLATRRSWDDAPGIQQPSPHEDPPELSSVVALTRRIVWLQMALFFIYTGLEVAVGQWSYTLLTESRAFSAPLAGWCVTLYWASILLGRIAFGFVVDRIDLDQLIRWSTVTTLLALAFFAWNPTVWSAPVALALAGLGLAIIFPCLMSRTPTRVGKDVAAHAIGFQVGAAMLGAAALPSVAAVVAQKLGLAAVGWSFLGMALALFILHELVLARLKRRS